MASGIIPHHFAFFFSPGILVGSKDERIFHWSGAPPAAVVRRSKSTSFSQCFPENGWTTEDFRLSGGSLGGMVIIPGGLGSRSGPASGGAGDFGRNRPSTSEKRGVNEGIDRIRHHVDVDHLTEVKVLPSLRQRTNVFPQA